MSQNLIEMIFILYRSGSMESLTAATIGGFDYMIEKPIEERGEGRITTILFDDKYELLHDHTPVQEIQRLTRKEYYARGCTALLDAVGLTIDRVGGRLAETPEEERPGRVEMVITTDGYENASRRYSRFQIQDMIRRQTDVYKWKFMFLGANMDAVSEADSMGSRPCMAATYAPSAAGVRSVFSAVGRMVAVVKLHDCDEGEEEVGVQCEAIMSSVR